MGRPSSHPTESWAGPPRGDNRAPARDSRTNVVQPSQGFVPLDNVVGRAFLITWPFARFGSIDAHHDVFAGVPDAETR